MMPAQRRRIVVGPRSPRHDLQKTKRPRDCLARQGLGRRVSPVIRRLQEAHSREFGQLFALETRLQARECSRIVLETPDAGV
jgi:hypothetical protein